MEKFEVKSYEQLSHIAATFIIEQIRMKPDSVLGLATGSTPVGLYQKLIASHQKCEISFRETTTFNLDEYVGLHSSHPQSYNRFMHDHLFSRIDINNDQIHIPNGETRNLQSECFRYEKAIKNQGPIDIQVLGLGVNGHIGFNEPGTSFQTRTHVVDLAESTREANARFFASKEAVPKQAITVGIDTIMDSHKIILLAFGEQKQAAIERLNNGEVSEDFPASILKEHPNVTLIYG
ncbi:glucosamine-6-phosphate deaminase [Filobacillus milosensis]|uniref:glucosamine-6-phosphate deaminase n=1 Tax=Filobacillus milosensis TaxID=94137 RepID=UPI001891688E|nr:glucosamine-6-phosphate deaminase [Filobacillus milosensis]